MHGEKDNVNMHTQVHFCVSTHETIFRKLTWMAGLE